MPKKPTELVPGTLEMLALKTLALEPMHAWGIALRIEQTSQGTFQVNPGSLLPALCRMEHTGYVETSWTQTENHRRAKYYKLTSKGHKALKTEQAEWERQVAAIHRILKAQVNCNEKHKSHPAGNPMVAANGAAQPGDRR